MSLTAYLQGIADCPDETVEIATSLGKRTIHRLTADFGIFDNWPIFLDADFCEVVAHLEETNYLKGKAFETKNHRNYQFFYLPGTVEMQVRNYVSPGLGSDLSSEEAKANHQRQAEEFTMEIILHKYQPKKIEGVSWERALSIVIQDIATYAQQENIPLCFPKATGWASSNGTPRAIYYP